MYQVYTLRTPTGRVIYAGRKQVNKIKSEDIVSKGVIIKYEIEAGCKLTLHKEVLMADKNEATMLIRKLKLGFEIVHNPSTINRSSIRQAIVDELTQDRRNYFVDFILNTRTGTLEAVECKSPEPEQVR